MADVIQTLNPNEKRILLNDNPDTVLVFDPTSTDFAKRFYKVRESLNAKLDEYEKEKGRFAEDGPVDELGVPKDINERIDLMEKACIYVREQIDDLFGAGTSQMVFGDTLSIEFCTYFLEQITPFITHSRAEKMAPYIVPAGLARKGGKKRKRGLK